jgi:hypothetical protein
METHASAQTSNPDSGQDDMEVEDAKPAAIPSVTASDQAHSQDEDPLTQLNARIERIKAQLQQLKEAKAAVQGQSEKLTNNKVLSKEQPFIPVGKTQLKNPPPTSVLPTQILPSSTVSPPNSNLSPFASLATAGPVYPVIPDPSPKRPYFSRYSWRIDIPQSAESPAKGLAQAITKIWNILWEADEKLIIYPWRMSDHGRHKPLNNPSKLPTTKEGITRYFRDAYFRPHPGSMYIKVFLGTSISDEELGKQTQHFFGVVKNRTRVGMWKSNLQFRDVVDIGWLY